MGEDVRFFHSKKKGVDRVFVDHPMFLAKVRHTCIPKSCEGTTFPKWHGYDRHAQWEVFVTDIWSAGVGKDRR